MNMKYRSFIIAIILILSLVLPSCLVRPIDYGIYPASTSGNVTTVGGTNTYIPKFTGSASIGISSLTDNGTDLSVPAGYKIDGVDISTLSGGSSNSTRSATLKVAANNASALEKSQADYVCDGVADQVQIDAALTAAGAGSVELSSGTFNLDAQINITSSQTLRGQGKSTIITPTTNSINLVRSDGGAGTEKTYIVIENICFNGTAGGKVADHLIYFDYTDNSTIRNCWLLNSGTANKHGIFNESCDYNKIIGNYSSGNLGQGISNVSCTNNIISNNTCVNNGYNGIIVNTCSYFTVSGNVCYGNSYAGIHLYGALYGTISGNACSYNTGTAGTYGGISTSTSCIGLTISGNACYYNTGEGLMISTVSYCTISNNVCISNYRNIFLYACTFCTISGNICKSATAAGDTGQGIGTNTVTDCNIMGNECASNNIGIYVGTGCARNNISGNACLNNLSSSGFAISNANNNSITSNYSYGNLNGVTIYTGGSNNNISNNKIEYNLRYGVYIDSNANSNLISGNTFYANSQQTTNTYDDLRFAGTCDYNLIQNNLFRSGAGAKVPKYAINFVASTCDNNLIWNNDMYNDGYGTALINNGGTGTLAKNNRGYLTENSGTAQINAGASSTNVTHGLVALPTRVLITATSDPGAANAFFVGTKATTWFLIQSTVAVTNNTSFDWRAVIGEGN